MTTSSTTPYTGFRISEFRTALQGGSRPNLFKVKINAIPAGVDSVIKDGFEFVCRAAALPASSIGLIEVPINAGRRLKMGGDRTFAEWTTTVLNDENFNIRSNMELWQSFIVNNNFNSSSVGSRQFTGNDLYTTVEVYQLNDNGEEVNSAISITLNGTEYNATKNFGSAKLINCWPSDLSTIDLSYDTTDTVEEFTITWVYDYCVYGDNTDLDKTDKPSDSQNQTA